MVSCYSNVGGPVRCFVSTCCVYCIVVQFLLIVDIMCIFFVGCGYVYLLVVQLDGWRDMMLDVL